MKAACLFSAFLAFGSLAQAGERTACAPLTDISCDAWSRQAEMFGSIVAVQAFESSEQVLCKVTVKPDRWKAHVLCPLWLTAETVSYDICGSCPEVGEEVSGYLLSDGEGLTILD